MTSDRFVHGIESSEMHAGVSIDLWNDFFFIVRYNSCDFFFPVLLEILNRLEKCYSILFYQSTEEATDNKPFDL